MPEVLELDRLDVAAVVRWAAVLRAAFAAHRAEIDALNVFPVPDGDTGTNLYLTLDGALDAARTALERDRSHPEIGLPTLCRHMSRAMLLSARGNSGVILSQLFQGLTEHVVQTEAQWLDGPEIASGLRRADELAWRSVAAPREGTILSVSRAAATAAEAAGAAPDSTLVQVLESALDAARAALARTPAQLPVLERAGVVDAGGAGYVLLLEALARVVSGAWAEGEDPLLRHTGWSRPADAPQAPISEPHLGGGGPSYEVMYLLRDSDEARVDRLRDALESLGDSLLVVGGDGVWNVHVHVEDVGAAVEAGIEAGRPYRIRVAHFGDQIAARTDPAALAVVACAAGDGLAEVLRAAGAAVVFSAPGRRASAGQLLQAARSTHAGRILMLPNDADTELAAQAAARAASEDGLVVRVVRTRTAVQGIAALAVFDAGGSLEDNVVAMSSAAAGTRHGAVTVARKEALTSAGWCRIGDVLGVIDGDFAIVGHDLFEVAGEVVERLLASGGDLLTIISGVQAPPDLAGAVAAAARIRRRDLEITQLAGGQELYPLLLGVE